MYFLRRLRTTLRVPPSGLGPNLDEAVAMLATSTLCRRAHHRGTDRNELVLSVIDVIEVSDDGVVCADGSGYVAFDARIECLVMRLTEGERVLCRVTQGAARGAAADANADNPVSIVASCGPARVYLSDRAGRKGGGGDGAGGQETRPVRERLLSLAAGDWVLAQVEDTFVLDNTLCAHAALLGGKHAPRPPPGPPRVGH